MSDYIRTREEKNKEYGERARKVYRELRKLGIPAKLIKGRGRLYSFTTLEVKGPEGNPLPAVNVVWRRRSENLMEEGLFVKDGRGDDILLGNTNGWGFSSIRFWEPWTKE